MKLSNLDNLRYQLIKQKVCWVTVPKGDPQKVSHVLGQRVFTEDNLGLISMYSYRSVQRISETTALDMINGRGEWS